MTTTNRPYPASQPFPSKYHGTCAYSGLRVWKGESIRRIIDGFDQELNKEINPRYVKDVFVSMACEDENWTRLTDGSSSVMDTVTERDRFTLVKKDGRVTSVITYKGGKFTVGNGSPRSLAQMKRMFDSAIAINVLPSRAFVRDGKRYGCIADYNAGIVTNDDGTWYTEVPVNLSFTYNNLCSGPGGYDIYVLFPGRTQWYKASGGLHHSKEIAAKWVRKNYPDWSYLVDGRVQG